MTIGANRLYFRFQEGEALESSQCAFELIPDLMTWRKIEQEPSLLFATKALVGSKDERHLKALRAIRQQGVSRVELTCSFDQRHGLIQAFD